MNRYRTIIQTAIIPYVYDTDFQTRVLDVATTNSFAMPSSSVLQALDIRFRAMKTSGVMDELESYIWACTGVGYSDFARIDWKKAGNLYSLSGGITHTADGFEGNAVDGFLTSNINPGDGGVHLYQQDKAFRIMTVYKTFTTGSVLDGISTSSTAGVMYNNSTTGHRINSVGNLSTAFDMSGTGRKTLIRINSTDLKAINKAVVGNYTVASIAIPSTNRLILRRGSTYGDAGFIDYGFGGLFTEAMNTAERTSVNACLTALGKTPVA